MSSRTESAMSTAGPSFTVPNSHTVDRSSSARTPSVKSPTKNVSTGISLAQKQAVLDNLQQEITVRARRLRAQYGTQAEGLRTRVEFRVNRIPPALRKQKLGDLMEKHSEESVKPSASQSTVSHKNPMEESQGNSRTNTDSPEHSRGKKRHSDEISTNKENEDVTNPKKRLRGPVGVLNMKTSHPDLQPSQVLSPKSSNSHIQPKSQTTRATQLGKSQLARPVSPYKPTGTAGLINNFVEKAKSTRAGTARKAVPPPATASTAGVGRGGKKAPIPRAPTRTAKGRASSASETSNTSNGTTIVTKPATVKKAPASKRTVMSTIKNIGAGGKKVSAPNAGAPAAGRVLRKRN